MSQKLLKKYIRLLFENQNARVPTQLIDPDHIEHDETDNEEEIDEFSSVAGVMGGSGLGGVIKKKQKSLR